MFKELAPLLRHRAVLFTVSPYADSLDVAAATSTKF